MTSDILTPDNVVAQGSATTKEGAIREAGELLVRAGAVTPAYIDAMLERESSVSTYMGNFLAIPHGTNEAKDAILRSSLSLVRYSAPVDWDGDEVRFAVGIAGLNNEHLEILSKIALVVAEEENVERLVNAETKEELLAIFEEAKV